ncbi:hypothetical protein AURANDRAFT_62984 [Aureococcus anophagefferens]|uniref:Uncharacterized protein n=1 Tax=Aureococcus anophagefferens TaxID=44056 RepID=F0Y4Z9_AURAN|nr:hypothetical protein AURANDRAFT_62984 [Aureococcus anophagefferens]EGB09883.1 hypothetical protein AURANDRAFT_62984 [Aureococcus anophagefferens]|eukprot:XP_009035910.1 hypothetical protein AURANDRAFT_62984 [Aureococcus anophagefferens]
MLARVSATTVIVAVAVDTRADLSGAVRALAAASDAARRPKPLKLVAFREKPITYPVATQSQLEPSIRAMHSPAFERVLLDALRRKDPGEANAPAGSSCCIIYISSRGELRYAGSHLIEKELWERHKNEFFELLRAGDARKLEALLRFLLKTRVNQHASTCRAGTAPDDMVDYFKEFKTSTEFKTSFRPAFAFYSKAGWSRAVFLHGVQYPAESRLIDVIGPDGDWFFNVNSAPVAGGNVWSFYVLDVDDVVRLSCHTLAATKKRVESWKRSTFKETMAKKPQHEKDAQQKQRLKTKAENLAPERLAREEAYQEPDDLVPVDLMPATVAVKELYLRGGCDQFGQKSIARSMGGAKAVKKRLVEKRAEMAAKRAAAAGLANPAAPRAPGAVVEEAPRRSSSRGSGRGPAVAAGAPKRRVRAAAPLSPTDAPTAPKRSAAIRASPPRALRAALAASAAAPAAAAPARRSTRASSAAAAPPAAAPAPPPRRSTRASAGAPASSAPLAPSSPRDRARVTIDAALACSAADGADPRDELAALVAEASSRLMDLSL